MVHQQRLEAIRAQIFHAEKECSLRISHQEDSVNYLIRACMFALVIDAFSWCAFSQERPRTVTQVSSGNPWTRIIPDPDKFDWSVTGGTRAGYYYRGLLPKHEPFYEYIQEKRKNDLPLSWAEESLVRHLITVRRWPDPPSPNPFWAACMRYLRAQPDAELSLSEMILLEQLSARGFTTGDPPDERNFTRLRDYLNSATFEIRNWFERTSVQHETWIENLNSGWGYDLPYDAPYDPSIADTIKVEFRETLSRLNDRDTSLGREIEIMQKSLASGDEAWDVYVARRNKELSADASAESRSYAELDDALSNAERWRKYMEANRATLADETTSENSAETPAEASASVQADKDETVAKAAEFISKAEAYAEKKDYAQAVFAYTRALDADPKLADAYAGRALAKAGLEDVEGAAGDINRALKLDAKCAAAYRARSIIKRTLADLKGAMADADRAIELAPANARNYLVRGFVYEALKDYRSAIFDYTVAIDLDRDNDQSFLYRGLARLKTNQDSEAIVDFDKVISIDANNDLAYVGRGSARENVGDLKGALSDYMEALRINPRDEAARQGLTRLKLPKK
jgi:tetratricopeptide (TPR) repeat protein